MAEAVKNSKKIVVVKPQEVVVEYITLTITMEEARALKIVLGGVGGYSRKLIKNYCGSTESEDLSRRGLIDNIRNALASAGVLSEHGDSACYTGAFYFKEEYV